jgi:hypothetical protein
VLRLRFQAMRQRLVLALTDVGKPNALGTRCGFAVEIDRNGQLLADPFTEPLGQLDAVLHRGTLHGNEGADIGGAHARVLALVLRHVDQLGGLSDQPEGSLDHRVGRPGKGDHRPVGSHTRIDIEQHRALGVGDLGRDGVDDGPVPAFADVRHALDELHGFLPCVVRLHHVWRKRGFYRGRAETAASVGVVGPVALSC